MEIKLSEIATAFNSLQNIADRKFPIKLSYAINKNIQLLKGEFLFYQNKVQELYDSYLEKDKDGNYIILNETDGHVSLKIKEGMQKEFGDKLKELNEITAEINVHTIKLDLLLESNVEIEPTIIESISFILEE